MHSANERKDAWKNSLEQAVVTTPDMSCGHCVAAIEREVGALGGVQQVKADLPTKQVTILFDPVVVSLPAIEETLDEAGYPVAR